MSLDPSQIVGNMQKSFNVYLEDGLTGETVNFNEDPFDTGGLESWYAVRYVGYSTESTGMGDLIEEDTSQEGRLHVLECEVSAWCRDDPQRAELGEMVDKVMALCEVAAVTFYDFADPRNPVEIGDMWLRPQRGTFSPVWGGGGPVWKSSGDEHAEAGVVGFVLEMNLVAIAEVG